MKFEQMIGAQMDAYERVWTRVMLACATVLLAALFGVYFFRSNGKELLVCCIVSASTVVVGLIAAAKLRELERGLTGSDGEQRGDLHSALGELDD